MNAIIVAHHTRLDQAMRLREQVSGYYVVDWDSKGALWGHMQALRLACDLPGRAIIMEDDAQPVEGFLELVQGWIARFPADLISFYLGTGRPKHWQPVIEAEMSNPGDYIALNELIHGVCYSIPQGMQEKILSVMPKNMPADYSIGQAWRSLTKRTVIYPKYSLVDHDDGESVENHPDGQPRTEVRKAWRLYGT